MPNECADPVARIRESEARLREALESELLGRAAESLAEYRMRFEEVWNRLSSEERRRSDLPTQALSLMEWARSVAVSVRASTLEQRRAQARPDPYRETGKRKTWQLTI